MEIYNGLKEVCDRFSTEEQLCESMLTGNTQKKRMLKYDVGALASKNNKLLTFISTQ